MKTDPTAGISGAAGTPLSHQAIDGGQRSTTPINSKTKPPVAISDTVETSDRDADGRQQAGRDQDQPEANQVAHDTDHRLDLTG